MSPSRRLSNGRSPLVRKQCQITSFFSPGKSPAPNPSSPRICSDQSPLQGKEKQKKPLLVIPSPSECSPAAPLSSGKKGVHSSEVIGKRIRVFWPLDNAWYEGYVLSFEEASGKHAIQYDDGEEEFLDLKEEKFELLEGERPRNLRRLRRMSGIGSPASSKPLEVGNVEAEGEISKGVSLDDVEWAQVSPKEVTEDDSEYVELENEGDSKEEAAPRSRKRAASISSEFSTRLGKQRKNVVEKTDCIRTIKLDDQEDNAGYGTPVDSRSSTCTHHANSFKSNQLLEGVDFNVNGEVASRFEKRHTEKFKFLGIERKDASGRRPGDADYNPKTLYLPQEFLKSLTGGQRQWWEFKSKHMDKVLFFKMGKFYELFEMDAHIGARELDLQYMKGDQPHCGFPEKNFSLNLEKLARKGYRVLVIEQTETPEQLELRRKEGGTKDKVVKREVCAVVSKGTLFEGETLLLNPDTSYLMSITENVLNFDKHHFQNTVLGVCVVDVSSGKFTLGQFDDNLERDCLCSILSELRPVEIIKPFKVLSPETEKVLMHNTRNPLVNTLDPSSEFWNAEKTILEIKKIYSSINYSGKSGMLNDSSGVRVNGSYPGVLPNILSELYSAGQNGCFALSALGGSLFYLRQAFLDETLLKCANFEALSCVGSLNRHQRPYMILDAPALENLEILENRNGNLTGTLYTQLDHCVTAFGKRLLKSWLARPLYDIDSIVARQDAISAFKDAGFAFALEFRKMLSGLPDMERLLSRQFANCEAFGRNSSAIILYEDASRKKLMEFLGVLRGCLLMDQASSSLSSLLTITNSSLIHHLLTPGKSLPDVSELLKYFKDAFNWSEAERSGRIIPQEGCDADFDAVCKVIFEVESGLTKHLKDQQKLLGNSSINYATVGKDSYLLEVPESLRSAIPRDYELHSSKKGYFRYWTAEIKKYISELSKAEAEKESKLQGILLRLMVQFSEHHIIWRQLISIIAELDVLISLAIASSYYEGSTCRPVIKDIKCSNNTTPFLTAKSLGHPTLRVDALGKGSFVPNDVNIGETEQVRFILLTGPNMGGKSTLLRQVCMAIILAQIGADVPAECFELSPVDRIFVRMGARDHIFTGQSTFLTELTETASVLASATQNSFVALDELGRGTSTSDGQAVAGSVLQFLVHETDCRGIFSTHYHRLAEDFCKDSKVSVCHMACQVEKGANGVEEVTFLYKLTPGSCPKSYGVNVARLAGVPPSVLQRAVAKSADFEAFYGILKDKEMAVVEALVHISKAWKQSGDSGTIDIRMLREIQQRAQLLLSQS